MFQIFKQREELTQENKRLKQELDFLRQENNSLKEETLEYETRLSVVESWEDTVPEDSEKRQQYMSDITMHYNNVMKSRIGKMIDDQKEALSKIDCPAQYAQIYRSNINCLLLMKGFYERCQAEHLGTLHEKRQEVEGDDEITRLKDSIYG